MLTTRDIIDAAFGSLGPQWRPEPDDSDAGLHGFTVNPFEPEVRARNARSFRAALIATGANVSPSNVVLFNPNGSGVTVVLNKVWFVIANVLALTLFGLAADPGLAAGPAALNQRLGAPAPKAIVENADAATPANTGALYRANGNNQFIQDAIAGGQIIMPAGTGVNLQFATSAAVYSVTLDWDELTI